MYCTNCGHEIDKDDKFCAACGHEKKEVIINKNTEDRKVNVQIDNDKRNDNNKKNDTSKRNPKKKVFYSVGIIFSIIAISIIVFSLSKGKNGANQLSGEKSQTIGEETKTIKEDSKIIEDEPKSIKEKTNTSERHLFPIHVDNKFGYIDKTGIIIIEPQFYNFRGIDGRYNVHKDDYDFHEGLSCVGVEVGDTIKYGFINNKGDFILDPIYDEARNFYDGLASVTIDNKKGFINKKGEFAFEHDFDIIENFSEGLAYFEKRTTDKKDNYFISGFIDHKGQIRIKDIRLPAIRTFEEGYVGAGYDNKFIDKDGNDYIASEDYIIHSNFSEGMAVISQGLKYGFIDKNGEMVIRPRFEKAKVFSEGLAAVQLKGKWGYIKKDGSLAIPFEYDFAFNFSDGMAAFSNNEYIGEEHQRKDHRLGFINKEGNIEIEPQFPIQLVFLQAGDGWLVSNLYRFINGLAYVPIDGIKIKEGPLRRKWGYINKKGEFVWAEKIE